MNEIADTVKCEGRNMTIFGVIAIILGILAMLAPGLAGKSVTLLIGVFVIVGGIVRMIWALKAGSLGKGLLMFAIGGLTLICGLALMGNPLFTAGVLTVILAVYFVVDGIFEIAAGFRLRSQPGWGWMLFGGIVSILFGIMIWRQFPLSGVWAIGILLGIKLFFVGLIMVTGGSVVRSTAQE